MKYTFKEIREKDNNIEPILHLVLKPVIHSMVWLFSNFTRVTPNQLSFISLMFGLICAYCFIEGGFILGAIFYLLRYLFDAIDGMVGRLKEITSKFGAFLDNYTGLWCNVTLIIGFGIGMYRITNNIMWFIIELPLFFLMMLHFVESTMASRILGKDNYKKKVNSLLKYKIPVPLNTQDVIIIIFVFSSFWFALGWLEFIVITIIILLLIKQIVWFFYYKNMLQKKGE